MIGNFPSLDDNQFKKVIEEVRKCQPASLKSKASPLPFAMAFGLANPMLPPPHQRGVVDPYIESINLTRPYTLLRNQRRYTVQIATFTGRTEYYKASDKIPDINQKKSDLEKGEAAAVKLCKTLRERGVEAYEFHDRYASIVTVGGFDQPSRRMADGTIVIDPQVQQIIQQYQGQITGTSYNPVIINGIECDAQPRLIEVPRVRRK
jgi:hypothetical protein